LYSLNNVRTLYSDNKQILYSLNNVKTLYSDNKQILYSLNNVRTLYSDNKQILYKSNSVRTLFFYSDSRHQIKMGYRSKFSGADHPSVKVRGGPGRNHEVVMELQLTKVYCIYLYHPILITPISAKSHPSCHWYSSTPLIRPFPQKGYPIYQVRFKMHIDS
jgi:hypothetical protein